MADEAEAGESVPTTFFPFFFFSFPLTNAEDCFHTISALDWGNLSRSTRVVHERANVKHHLPGKPSELLQMWTHQHFAGAAQCRPCIRFCCGYMLCGGVGAREYKIICVSVSVWVRVWRGGGGRWPQRISRGERLIQWASFWRCFFFPFLKHSLPAEVNTMFFLFCFGHRTWIVLFYFIFFF